MSATATGYGWGNTRERAVRDATEHAKGMIAVMGANASGWRVTSTQAKQQGNSWTATVELETR